MFRRGTRRSLQGSGTARLGLLAALPFVCALLVFAEPKHRPRLFGASVVIMLPALAYGVVRHRRRFAAALGPIHATLARCLVDRSEELVRANAALLAEVTERRRLEAALRESDDRLQTDAANGDPKRAQQALRRSEEPYRSLVAAAGSVVWTADAHGFTTSRMPSWEAYSGQTWEEYQSRGWLAGIHPDDRHHFRQRWEIAVASVSPFEAEGRFWHHPSREYRLCVSRGVPLLNPDGSLGEWIGTLTDVHDQRRAEETRSQLAAIVAASPDGIVGLGLNGEVLSWNAAAERLFGYGAAEAIGVHIGLIVPPERENELLRLLGAVRHGASVTNHETILRRADGSSLNVSISLAPIHNAEGTASGVSAVISDISARRRTEEALRRSETRLKAVIASATDAIITVDPQAHHALQSGRRGHVPLPGRRCLRAAGRHVHPVAGRSPRRSPRGR